MTKNIINEHSHHFSSHSLRKTGRTSAVFLFLVLLIMPIVVESGEFSTLGIVFVGIMLEAVPFMLVGALAGGLIETFISPERLALLLPRKRWIGVFVAAGAGIFLPVCECAVVPVVRRLLGKGLPLSAAVAYLLGGPIVNPIVAASTTLAYAFDMRIVLLRLILGYGIAVTIGLVMEWLFSDASVLKETEAHHNADGHYCGVCHSFKREDECVEEERFGQSVPYMENRVSSPAGGSSSLYSPRARWRIKLVWALIHGGEDFFAVAHYLVMGAFIAALAQTYIERSAFIVIIEAPLICVGLMMALAVLLNLCSEADAFIAASFRGLMPISAQLAFMLTGPMFDLKLLLMYQSLFRKRAIVVLATLILSMVLIVGIVFEMWT